MFLFTANQVGHRFSFVKIGFQAEGDGGVEQRVTGSEECPPSPRQRCGRPGISVRVPFQRYDPEKGPGPSYQYPFLFTLTFSQRISSPTSTPL